MYLVFIYLSFGMFEKDLAAKASLKIRSSFRPLIEQDKMSTADADELKNLLTELRSGTIGFKSVREALQAT